MSGYMFSFTCRKCMGWQPDILVCSTSAPVVTHCFTQIRSTQADTAALWPFGANECASGLELTT